MALTPEEQWEQINYSRTFLTAVMDRVKTIWTDLATLQADADVIRSNINEVPLVIRKYSNDTNFCTIEIGTTSHGDAQVSLIVPKNWITEV